MDVSFSDVDAVFRKWFRVFQTYMPPECKAYGGYGISPGVPNGTACSAEALHCFLKLVDPNIIYPVLDMGAGASTFVIRTFCQNVVTVDPDQSYLAAVENLCQQEGLNTQGFERIGNLSGRLFSHAFVDYGDLSDRAWAFALVQHRVTDSAFFDDCDGLRGEPFAAARHAVTSMLKDTNNWMFEDCLESKDSYGRWGITARRMS